MIIRLLSNLDGLRIVSLVFYTCITIFILLRIRKGGIPAKNPYFRTTYYLFVIGGISIFLSGIYFYQIAGIIIFLLGFGFSIYNWLHNLEEPKESSPQG